SRAAQQGHARGEGAEESGAKEIAHAPTLVERTGCSARVDSSSPVYLPAAGSPADNGGTRPGVAASRLRRPRAMTQTSAPSPSLLRIAGLPYFVIAFIARLPFAMMVVGVLTIVVTARGSLALRRITSAAVGLGTAVIGPFLGAAADRFGQRPVLVAAAVLNAVMLGAFAAVVYSPLSEGLILLSAFAIGASAPQVAPMSRSRLVTIIDEQMPSERRIRTTSATMSYESAADETVFVVGPFLVGVLASLIAPWAPIVLASALTLLFVGAFALHPTGRHVSAARSAGGAAPSA